MYINTSLKAQRTSQNRDIKNDFFISDAGMSEHPFRGKTKLDPYHTAHTRINYR